MTNPLLRKSLLALTFALLLAGTAVAQITTPGPSPDGSGGGGGGPDPGCTGNCLVAVHLVNLAAENLGQGGRPAERREMHLTAFVRIVWAATFANYVLLLFVLIVRRRARSFPAFTAYVTFLALYSATEFVALNHLAFSTYRNIYYSLQILDEGIQILVFYELAVHVFCPTGTWARDVRRAFLGLVAASAGVAFLLAWLAQPPAPLRVQTFILRADFFSSLLLSELFVGTVALAVTAGLPWKTHVARIAQGLGAYSLLCLAIGIGVTSVGITTDNAIYAALIRVRKLIWIACQVYWIVTLWREAPAPRELPEVMRAQVLLLQNRLKDDLIRIRGRRNR